MMTEKELHLCECGCGQETNIYRGKPRRFIHGHHMRVTRISDPINYKIVMEGITQDLVRELFDYQDGDLYWKKSRGNIKAGDRTGSDNQIYKQLQINHEKYYVHQIVFLYHHGYIPNELDHIDGNNFNNDIENLRSVTHSQNQHNRSKHKLYDGNPTSSQYKGVNWDEKRNKWRSRIVINKREKHLGYFEDEIEAARAYDEVAIEAFGEFAKLNFDDRNLYKVMS